MSGAQAWPHLVTLAAATALAGIGGELFVRGVVGAAARWRLSELLVAMTVAACATSAPELTVSILASSAGNSALAMGDALGSNVTNVLLILGIALLFGPLPANTAALRWHFACVLGAPLVAFVMLVDGTLSRWDGGMLLMLFGLWLGTTVMHIRRGTVPDGVKESAAVLRPAVLLLFLVGGVALLAVAGQLFADGGRAIADLFSIPDTVVGATVVALGTSMPELMTTLVARWRGHHEVGLGTLLGSNLFNGLVILGTAALIAPIQPSLSAAWVVLAFGALAILLALPRQGSLGRGRGAVMLVCYALYVAVVGIVLGIGDPG